MYCVVWHLKMVSKALMMSSYGQKWRYTQMYLTIFSVSPKIYTILSVSRPESNKVEMGPYTIWTRVTNGTLIISHFSVKTSFWACNNAKSHLLAKFGCRGEKMDNSATLLLFMWSKTSNPKVSLVPIHTPLLGGISNWSAVTRLPKWWIWGIL
jgi:hypothetical protein